MEKEDFVSANFHIANYPEYQPLNQGYSILGREEPKRHPGTFHTHRCERTLVPRLTEKHAHGTNMPNTDVQYRHAAARCHLLSRIRQLPSFKRLGQRRLLHQQHHDAGHDRKWHDEDEQWHERIVVGAGNRLPYGVR